MTHLSKEQLQTHWENIKAFKDGAEIQYLSKYDGKWKNTPNPPWDMNYEYRVKPAEPDVVPWDVIHPKFRWYARDYGGNRYVYTDRPRRCKSHWTILNTFGIVKWIDEEIFYFVEPTIHWKDSLQERPQ